MQHIYADNTAYWIQVFCLLIQDFWIRSF